MRFGRVETHSESRQRIQSQKFQLENPTDSFPTVTAADQLLTMSESSVIFNSRHIPKPWRGPRLPLPRHASELSTFWQLGWLALGPCHQSATVFDHSWGILSQRNPTLQPISPNFSLSSDVRRWRARHSHSKPNQVAQLRERHCQPGETWYETVSIVHSYYLNSSRFPPDWYEYDFLYRTPTPAIMHHGRPKFLQLSKGGLTALSMMWHWAMDLQRTTVSGINYQCRLRLESW